MTDNVASVVLQLRCSTANSPWENKQTPVLYKGQRLEIGLKHHLSDEKYFVAIHDGEIPVSENVDGAKVIVAVSVPDGHLDRFVKGREAILSAAQFDLAKCSIESVKPGYWNEGEDSDGQDE